MSSPHRTRSAVLAALTVAVLLCVQTLPAAAVPPNMDDCDLVAIPGETIVEVETDAGTLVLELYPSVAPKTVNNFLRYIARGDLDGTFVHRTETLSDGTTPFVIQMGGFRPAGIEFAELIDTLAPVQNEPCLSNVEGTVAMAKSPGDPDSATSQWFVNLGDNSFLDSSNGGFTAFGEVISGSLDVALDIFDLEQAPKDPIPPYYGTIVFPFWDIFRKSPLLSNLSEGNYGCFDPTVSGIVLAADPVSTQDWEPKSCWQKALRVGASGLLMSI
jgi:cyclophilin family peptidyl-prolyl cis-trans isomerase